MDALPVLGIDMGSVSVSCALLDASGEVLASGHRAHQGKVRETLAAAVADLSPGRVAGIGITGSGPRLIPVARAVDPLVALVVACRRLFPDVGSILSVGGERFSLIRFDEAGRYVGTRSNSSCAAGTGSFLDQQARRLGLASSRELAEAALANTGDAPRISTRCAVFARTDLVHAQQAGYSLEEICDGLCAGLARNVADTLLAGEPPRAPVIFAGGVAANEAVRRHLERLFGMPVRAHALSPVLGAIGAALDLLDAPAGQRPPLDLGPGIGPLLSEERGTAAHVLRAAGSGHRRPPVRRRRPPVRARRGLVLPTAPRGGRGVPRAVPACEASVHPCLAGHRRRLDQHQGGARRSRRRAVRRASTPAPRGRPVTAAQALLEAADEVAAKARDSRQVLGVGHHRRRAEVHRRASSAPTWCWTRSPPTRGPPASSIPQVDTIIEIGGQDAKFTTLRDGTGDLLAHEQRLRRGHRQLHRGAGGRRLGCDALGLRREPVAA